LSVTASLASGRCRPWHSADKAPRIVRRSCQSRWAWSNGIGWSARGPGHRGATLDPGRRLPWPVGRRHRYGSTKGHVGWASREWRHRERRFWVVPCARQP